MIGFTVAAVIALIAAWLVDRRRRIYADLETIPAAAVYAGRNEVQGRAWHGDPSPSHHTRTPCVVWTYALEEERRHTRKTDKGTTTETSWHTIDEQTGGRPHFDLVDDSGSVRVVLDRATLSARTLLDEEFEVDDPRSFFERMFSFGPDRTGRYRRSEQGIAVGDVVFVSGEASLRDDVAEPQIDRGSPLLVSTRSERSHRRWTGAFAVLLAVAGIGFAAAAGAATGSAGGTVAGAAVAGALVLSAGLLVLFNRIQLQVQSAVRAWSLIDVQLARRHDLIPRLAAVAAGAVAHERATQEAVAGTRTSVAGVTPDERALATVNDEAQAQTRRLRQLLAIIEAHPDLRAGGTMTELQRQLADTENRLAGTRAFYNDSVTLVRNQRTTFPGLLVARFADRRRFALFGTDGFERTVPEIEWDWDVGRPT